MITITIKVTIFRIILELLNFYSNRHQSYVRKGTSHDIISLRRYAFHILTVIRRKLFLIKSLKTNSHKI
jgi:hypothetical protein